MSDAKVSGCRCLADLSVGQSARIARVEGNGAIRQRLLDMGFTRGAVVRVKRLAPLGDPMQISIKGYDLALRRYEAQAIRYHDGQYIDENRSVAHRETKLTRLLQYADNWSGGILEATSTNSFQGER